MRVLVLAAAALTLSACWVFEDSPQYIFQVLAVAEGDEPVEFQTRVRGNGIILVGPFIAPCLDALITADVNESDSDLRLTVRARGCEGQQEPAPFDYELVWSGLDDGTYSLTVRHENEAGAQDGTVYQETIVIR